MIIEEITINNQQLILLTDNKTKAIINLNLGASLQELYFDEKKIIADISENYKSNYASSILFPFVNRIDDGKYNFEDKIHQLPINEPSLNNAIHGFIYDKKFTLKEQHSTNDFASVVLEYNELSKNIGFSFTYKIQLEYKLSKNNLQLKINVKNTDKNHFPFTIGWHPYFYSNNLTESKILFEADKKVIHNKKMIAVQTENYKSNKNLALKKLDDCFRLTDKKISFITPEYHLEMESEMGLDYLQIYTPDNPNCIAIEPLTGVSNSFNNKIGLQILQPNETFTTSWNLNLKA